MIIRKFSKHFLLLLLVAQCLVITSPEISEAEEKQLISMDFDNADIRVVIKFISELTGKNIVVDSKVKGTVTVISPARITPEEAYKVFESILEVNDYSAIQTAGIIKIVPKPDAAKSLSSTRTGKESKRIAREDRIITQIIPLEFADSPQVKSALAPLVSRNGIIVDYPATNTLIITDISSNIYRLVKIVQEIDTEFTQKKIEIITLEYADASNLAKQLTDIFPAKAGVAATRRRRAPSAIPSAVKIIPYERTNSVIVVADEDEMEKIKELVRILDVKTDVEKGEIQVYYLKNAVAEELANVLNSMVKTRGAAAGKAQGAGGVILSGDIIITPDKATNSLVITASPRDYILIRDVIEKLDIRRKQVYVEASIIEISLDKQREIGIEFRGTSDPTASSDLKILGGSTFGGIEAASVNPLGLAGQGLVVGAVEGVITFRGEEFLNVGALLRALETESGVNVLSTPHLLTTDNEEAEIIVGENVPFIISKSQTTAGEPIETIERKDVGIKLNITPQINESEFVTLKIFQEISNVKETQLETASDLITTKRSARTTIVAKDGQTVAIGGLIRDDKFDVASKVPCLGDIPLLGILFRSTQKKKQKVNLLIFLTPKIINNPADIQEITEKKRKDIDALRQGTKPLEDNTHSGGSEGKTIED